MRVKIIYLGFYQRGTEDAELLRFDFLGVLYGQIDQLGSSASEPGLFR